MQEKAHVELLLSLKHTPAANCDPTVRSLVASAVCLLVAFVICLVVVPPPFVRWLCVRHSSAGHASVTHLLVMHPSFIRWSCRRQISQPSSCVRCTSVGRAAVKSCHQNLIAPPLDRATIDSASRRLLDGLWRLALLPFLRNYFSSSLKLYSVKLPQLLV
ncbi:unnamed protein product [Citrullus colocynthis]|uniref:Uncharacterized protein n=1 Tax=Citrullus colocynthis TaxID=252529 RepID=A0ABP0XVA1_9ROSI